MLVVFMRHAKAAEAKPGERDEDRRLTSEGVEEAVAVSRLLPRVRMVYSSPLRRAVETAEIVSHLHGAEYRVIEELAPGRYLKDLEPYFTDRALFVGHSPYVEDCVSELSGFRTSLPTAGAVGLRRVERGWTVEFLVTPRLAREVLERLHHQSREGGSRSPQPSATETSATP